MTESELPDTASSRGEEKKQRDDTSSGTLLQSVVPEESSGLPNEGGNASERHIIAPADVESSTPASTSSGSGEASKIEKYRRHEERKEAEKANNDSKGASTIGTISSSSTKNQQKLRLTPGVATTDSQPTKHQNLRLAPGVATDFHGAVRVGALDDAGVIPDGDNHHNVENIRIDAEVVQGEDPNTTAPVAVVVEERNMNKPLRIALAILALALAVIATLTVVLLTQSHASTEISVGKDGSVSPTDAPTLITEQPSSGPTMTTRTNKVKNILAEYSPLDKQALDWLTFSDTWEADKEDPNHDYLWLERYALALLYDSTGGSSWTYSNNWKTSEPVCKWYSSGSSSECPGPITDLNLYNNNLKGSLPSIIGNLSLLTRLSFSGNQLTSSIPSSIGNLSLLDGLWLWGNQLTSSIPSSIGKLSLLEYLDLYENQLTSSIPSSIGNLSRLKWLYLYDNKLTGSIPSLPSTIAWCILDKNCFQDLGNGETAGCDLNANCAPA